MLRILILNYEYPPLGGGAGVCTQYEAAGLAKLGNHVTVLSTWYKGFPELETIGSLEIIRIKSKRKFTYKSNPLEMISWVLKTKQYIKKNKQSFKFDACLANFIIPGGIVGKWIKQTFKIPLIIISHGQDIPFFFPKQMLKYHIVTYFWLRSIVKDANKLVLLTDLIKQNADKYLGTKNRSKNIIIPNGCDIEKFKPDYSKKSLRFMIIFAGRLVSQKDPMTFLKAIKILKDKISDFRVDILGDGPLRKKMEQFVNRNNLNKYISFSGWVNKEVMIEVYQTANLQVMTSMDEAMSIAALESLATGQYIISTPVSGNTELIKENVNGNFVGFGNYLEIANKILDYYNTKYVYNYKVPEHFLNEFRAKYNWDNIALQYYNCIKKLLIEENVSLR